ncbi:hypothetical protein K7460_29890, partial [Pseudomonas fluorescens]|nr:hypothetical protein [Pseudomonas fluorescens]
MAFSDLAGHPRAIWRAAETEGLNAALRILGQFGSSDGTARAPWRSKQNPVVAPVVRSTDSPDDLL